MTDVITKVRHPHLSRVVMEIERPPVEVVRRLARCYTGLVSDALGKLGSMHYEVKPIAAGMRLCGPALTYCGDDWTARKAAFELVQPGDVVIVAAGGSKEYANFGDFSATVLVSRGAAGVVVDGATRDVEGIVRLGLPVFARAVTPRNRHYPAGPEYCSVNLPVACAGVIVNPGDLVIGDADGVVVVPREVSVELSYQVERDLEQEQQLRQTLAAPGFSFGALADLEKFGYDFT
jgi:4-hydroxy-4-methyl-2-oxoglutarate aldolase